MIRAHHVAWTLLAVGVMTTSNAMAATRTSAATTATPHPGVGATTPWAPSLPAWRGDPGAVVPTAPAFSESDSVSDDDEPVIIDEDSPLTSTASPARRTLEALVPELAVAPYRLAPGPRPFLHRVSVTPSYGYLGAEKLFSFRVAYNPNSWLGYEGSIGHNPAQSVHAVLHTVSAVLRHPLPGRFQPYGSVGYGMMMVFPGRSINADPVTKNALTFGGGLELYIRSDLALRADVTHATVFGRQQDRDGVVAFDYLQETIGLSFYRTIAP